MNKLICLAILVLFIIGCTPASLRDNTTIVPTGDAEDTNSDDSSEDIESGDIEETKDTEKSKNETVEEPKKDPRDITINDRLDVDIRSSDARVTGTVLEVPYDFTVPFTDKDAIIFEVAKQVNKPLNNIRLIIYFDGNPYLKPSDKSKLEEEVQNILPTKDIDEFKYINYTFSKEDGFIRQVGCDLENAIIKINFVNEGPEPVKLYKEVVPKIKNALVIYLNSKMLKNLNCGGAEEIGANSSITCVKSPVIFIRAGSPSTFGSATYDESLQDHLVASRPGYSEKLTFECKEV